MISTKLIYSVVDDFTCCESFYKINLTNVDTIDISVVRRKVPIN